MNLYYKILIFLTLFYPGVLLYYYGYDDIQTYYEVTTNWVHNFEKNQYLKNQNSDNHPQLKRGYFFNRKSLVYYNQTGEILHKISVDSKTAISPDNDFYVIYPKLGKKIELFNNRGGKQWALDTYAIPKITPFRKNIVLISSDHNTLTVYDFNRNRILPPTYLGTLITDYDICKNNDGILIGTIEGNLYFYDSQVEQVFKKNFSGSDYSYFKSVACSPTGNHYLTLDGLFPEWLSLLNTQGESIWRVDTGDNRRTSTDIFIDESNAWVLDVKKKSVEIFSLEEGSRVGNIIPKPENGNIKKVVYDSTPGWMILGISGESANRILLLDQNFETIWENDRIETYLTYVEIQKIENQVFFVIHTLESIYSYRLIL